MCSSDLRVSGELIYRGGFKTSFALTAGLYLASTICYRIFFISGKRVRDGGRGA